MKRLVIIVLCVVGTAYAVPVTFLSPDQITTAPFSITSPGRYVLTDDVEYATAGGTAITIDSNDVTLDLNDKSVMHTAGGGAIAIFIADAYTNITIKNGALRAFDSRGIVVTGGSTELCFEDLVIIGVNGGRGIYLAGTSSSRIQGVKIENCIATNNNFGLFAQHADDVVIRDSLFNYNRFGMDVSQGRSWDIQRCQFSFNNSSAGFANVEGATVYHSECWKIRDSDFSFNRATGSGGGAFARGLRLFNNSSDEEFTGAHIVENCSFSENHSTNSSCLALDFARTPSCVARNCKVNGNSTGGSNVVRGINIGGGETIIEDCVVDGNFVTGGTSSAIGIGGGSGGHIVRTQCKNNFAAGSDSIGLLLNGSGNLIEHCLFDGNNSGGSGVSRGIQVGSGAANNIIKNCSAVANSHRGFENNATAGDNLFVGNVSFGHGSAGVDNYVGSIPFLSVAATGAYPLAGSFDNRSLANLSFT